MDRISSATSGVSRLCLAALLLTALTHTDVLAQAGDGRIVFGNAATPTAVPKFRAWDNAGSTWSGASNTSAADSTIYWTVHQFSPADSTEELVGVLAKISGTQSGLHLLRLSGGSWSTDWSSTAIDSTHADKRGFDVAYEADSGDALIVYSNNTTNPVYRTWNGSTWTGETDVFGSPPGTGVVLWVELVSRPSSDEIALTYVDDNADLFAITWDGTQWVSASSTTLETSVKTNPVSGVVSNRAFDAAYENSTGDLMVAWSRPSTSGFFYSTKAAGSTIWSAATQVVEPAALVE